MRGFIKILLVLGLIQGTYCQAQKLNFEQSESAIASRLKQDISVLASDSLMGRETGTEGEIMARDYIVSQYKTIGIEPFFDGDSYIQSFTFKDSPSLGESNSLLVGKKNYFVTKDYYPLSYSASTTFSGETVNVGYGIVVPSEGYSDYKNKSNLKGKVFVIETSLPEKYRMDTNFVRFLDLQKKVDTAVWYGASGIIFINSNEKISAPSSMLTTYILPSVVPVIFVKNQGLKKILSKSKPVIVSMQVDIRRNTLTGYNVAGYIENKAPTTIIIGGHYDHIGMGKEGSRYTGPVMQIHNGADDNASGTAGVMELARYFKSSEKRNHNYLFINFTGEEKGLDGSSFFTRSTYFDTTKIAFMLNLDMIGRYDTSKVGLNILGTGTSPLWDTLIAMTDSENLKIKKSKSGLEGSDQMSFYLKGVPVLFLFTGLHSDYHMPGDDIEKINFEGEAAIIKFAERIIEKTDSIVKIPFSKAKEESATSRTSMTVTLGVVPDHSWDGEGLRIDGTIPNKPAEKAGFKADDIILKIGEYDVMEIMSYMKALGHFKKGDKTKVIVKRGEETLTLDVEF